MLKKTVAKQVKYEFVCIENLVPNDHLLRKVAKYIDFSFITGKVKDLYCSYNGRPAIDPVVLFKMLFLGYLFGVRSERRLVEETKVNVAYRWFLGFTLEDKIPDASTFSQNRRRRFNQSQIYQEIFDEIVLQAIRRNMVGGRCFIPTPHILRPVRTKINLETTAQFCEVPEFRLSGLFRGENRQFCVIFRRSQAIYHLLWLLSPPKEALILSM